MADAARSDARIGAIRLERIRDLYGQPGTPVYAAGAIAALIAVQTIGTAWPVADRRGALIWVGIVIAAQIGLAVLVGAFHRRPRADAELPVWGALRTGGEVVHGLSWGLAAPMMLRPAEPLSLTLGLVTLVGTASGAASGLAVHVPALAAFVIAAMGSTCLFLAAQGDRTGLYAAAIVAVSTFWVMANGLRMSLLYRSAIELRLDLAEQVETRKRLQAEAEEGRRLAEAAGLERTRFFGAASHDLRQPVHALGLYAALLRRDPPAKARRDLIGAIGACVDTLDQLFNAILGVAQAAQARDDRRIEAVALQDLIGRVLLQVLPEAERRGLTLRARRIEAVVWADPTAVERILTNLVGNAIRYTERGGVQVAARRRGDGVALTISDTGVGLSEADRARVFDPFFRVADRIGPDGERGFGLGLATVRQLCLSHGYDIALRSRPGLGSRFVVTLPAADAPATPAATARGREAAAQASGEALGGDHAAGPLNVLVLEDDPLVADAIARLLEAWSLRGHVCATSAEAMAVLEQGLGRGRWFGILDYRLPGEETGLDVADAIRARFGPALPLALLTGELDPAVFKAAQRRKILVLQKPLRPIRLRAVLAAEAAA